MCVCVLLEASGFPFFGVGSKRKPQDTHIHSYSEIRGWENQKENRNPRGMVQIPISISGPNPKRTPSTVSAPGASWARSKREFRTRSGRVCSTNRMAKVGLRISQFPSSDPSPFGAIKGQIQSTREAHIAIHRSCRE